MSHEMTLYCTFRSSGRWYGVPVLDVKEVTSETSSTRIPHAPIEVLGFVNIRGHILLALDLAALLGTSQKDPRQNSQMVIFKNRLGPSFGIVVDEVGEIVPVRSDQTEEFSNQERHALDPTDRGALVSHVCKLDHSLLIVLDPSRFLPRVEHSLQELLKMS